MLAEIFATSERNNRTGADVQPGFGPRLMGANLFVGNAVFNQNDKVLGYIKEVMLDQCNGRVSFAVLSCGEFIGIGERLFAVPTDALRIDSKNQRVVLDEDKYCLENAPNFDSDKWPNMADPLWIKGIHTYYGTHVSGSHPSL